MTTLIITIWVFIITLYWTYLTSFQLWYGDTLGGFKLCTEVITYNIFMFYVYDNDDVLDNCDFKVVFILHTMKCRTSASLWQAMRKPFHTTGQSDLIISQFLPVMAIFYQSHHWIWSKVTCHCKFPPVADKFCLTMTCDRWGFAWTALTTDQVYK